MLRPSSGQQKVIDDVILGHNVAVTAAPGGGKTTLALMAITALPPTKTVLMISYNRALVSSTQHRVKSMFGKTRPNKIGVFTVHGLLSSILQRPISTDIELVNAMRDMPSAFQIVDQRMAPWAFINTDLLIIDEAQDQRPILFTVVRFMIMYVLCRPHDLQIFMSGQPRQLLYDFYGENSADARFLTQSDQLFPSLPRKWKFHHLPTSYRLTGQMCNFVNALDTTLPKILPSRSSAQRGFAVQFGVCDFNNKDNGVCGAILNKLGLFGSRDTRARASTMILAPSMNQRSAAIPLVNALLNRKLSVHVTRSGTLSETCTLFADKSSNDGTIQVKTYHASKGLEATRVIVLVTTPIFGDISNALFVALTRARVELIVLVHKTKVTLKGLKDFAARMQPNDITIRVFDNPTRKVRVISSSVPKNIHANRMFQFMSSYDLVALEHLIQHRLVTAGLDETSHVESKTTVDTLLQSDEINHRSQMSSMYARAMIIPCGNTTINVLGYAERALLYSVYHFLTYRFPPCVAKGIMLAQVHNHPGLGQKLDEAMNKIVTVQKGCVNHSDGDEVKQAKLNLQPFSVAAACLDGIASFKEKVDATNKCDFMLNQRVFLRFDLLLANMITIFERHPTVDNTVIVFEKNFECCVRYIEDPKAHNVRVCATPTFVIGASHEIVIHAFHDAKLTLDTLLTTSVDHEAVGSSFAYAINMFTGECLEIINTNHTAKLIQASLDAKTDKYQPQADSCFVSKNALHAKDLQLAEKLRQMTVGQFDDSDDDDDIDDDEDVQFSMV